MEMQIQRGFDSGDVVTKIAAGVTDIGFGDLGAIIKHNADHPTRGVVNVFQHFDRTLAAVMTLAGRGIARPADLKGKRLAAPVGDAGRTLFPAFARANGLTPSDVSWITVAPPLREPMLHRGEADALTAFVSRSFFILRSLGNPAKDIRMFRYNDHGVDIYGYGLLTTGDFAQREPEILRGFLRTLLAGLKDALLDPAAGVAASLYELANAIMISGIVALMPGDEKYAFTAITPMATKGLKLTSRRSYEAATTLEFDYPLSTRFNENDAVVFCDNVKIPWDRVFVRKDLHMMQAHWHETRAHVMQNYQCIVQLMVKLRFLLGLAHKVAEAKCMRGVPQTRETLNLLAAKSSTIEGLVIRMEAAGENFHGTSGPDRLLLVTAQVLAQTTYPKFIDAIRGLIMVPSSSAAFDGGEVEQVINASQRSSVTDSEGRVKLMKLVWDAVGSEFGSRHPQYKMFYYGPQFAIRGDSYRFDDWAGPKAMVENFMDNFTQVRPAARQAA